MMILWKKHCQWKRVSLYFPFDQHARQYLREFIKSLPTYYNISQCVPKVYGSVYASVYNTEDAHKNIYYNYIHWLVSSSYDYPVRYLDN